MACTLVIGEDRVIKFFANLRHRRRSNSRLALICIAVMVITMAAAGLMIWGLRQDAIKTYQQEIKNLGVAFAEQTSRTLQAVDLVLDQTKERILSVAAETPEQFGQLTATEEFHNFLIDRLKNLPQADAISVVAANGTLINYTRQWPVPDLDLSDRDFVEFLRLHDEPTSFFSKPDKNRSTGAWSVYVARRTSGPTGEFLGVVVVTIRSEYF